MRREERVTVQGPVKEQQPDGMSHRGGGWTPPPPLKRSRGEGVGGFWASGASRGGREAGRAWAQAGQGSTGMARSGPTATSGCPKSGRQCPGARSRARAHSPSQDHVHEGVPRPPNPPADRDRRLPAVPVAVRSGRAGQSDVQLVLRHGAQGV